MLLKNDGELAKIKIQIHNVQEPCINNARHTMSHMKSNLSPRVIITSNSYFWIKSCSCSFSVK